MRLIYILWTLLLAVWTDALKTGEPGVCIKMIRVSKTRMTTYEASVKCPDGRRTCTKLMTKPEDYMEKQLVEFCCDNYLYVEKNGTEMCTPECEHDCEGGSCVAPNVCICEPPLVLHNANEPHRCVPPVCDNPCVHGVCTANNQCTCNDGYALQNDNFTCIAQCTNCSNGECIGPNECSCLKGYSMESGRCTPQCDNCSHGFCSAPNICSCDLGYELKNNTCEPVCEKTCVNAKCVAPDTCECFEGFQPKNGEKGACTPKCESCKHGTCSAPNRCECDTGYTLSDNDCVPRCEEPCINGYCHSPNECSCNDGYVKDAVNASVCRKPCSCIGGACNLEGECKCETEMTLVKDTCVLIKPEETSSSAKSSGITRSTTGLASLQMSWWVGGAVGLLLMVLVLVVMSRIWHTRKNFPQKTPNEGPFGSVAYTLPNTLMRGDEVNEAEPPEPNDALLTKDTSAV